MKFLKIYLFVALGLIINLSSTAQSNNYLTYGVEDGLIQSQIEHLIQDHEGKLWIGTIGGLTIYDGVNFKSFTTKEGLSEDWISSFHKDMDDNIWMGHWGGGITKYNKSKDQFEIIKLERDLQYRKIIKFIELGKNDHLIITEGAGIYRYADNELKSYTGALKSLDIKDAVYDKALSLIWMATGDGIQIINLSNNKVQGFILNMQNGLPSNQYTSVAFTLNNEIWFGTKNAGIVRFNKNVGIHEYAAGVNISSKITRLTTANGLTSNEIDQLLGTSQNQVWIGTKNKGINTFHTQAQYMDLEDFKPGTIKVFGNSFELKYYNANTLFEDREQNIWIGTEIGLNKYLGELFKIYDERNLLKNNLIWSTFIDSKDRLWVGSSEGISCITFKMVNGQKKL